MTTYDVTFRTDAEAASIYIEAESPEQAIILARKLYEDDPSGLCFEPYGRQPVNQIDIDDEDGDPIDSWYDDDMRLRIAARDLLEAAELTVARWSEGDLAEAVRALDAAIAKAKGGAQ